MRKALLFLVIVSFLAFWNISPVFAQSKTIDSLKSALAHQLKDSSKVKLLNRLALELILTNSNSEAKQYAGQAQQIVQKLNVKGDSSTDQVGYNNQHHLMYGFIFGFFFVFLIAAIIVNRFRSNIKTVATHHKDTPETVVKKMSIVIISIATCFAALIWAWLYYFYFGWCLPTLGPVIYFLVVTPAVLIYFKYKNEQLLADVQLFCIFAVPVLMEWTSGGFQAGVVMLWALLAPVGALMYKSMRHAAVWMALFVASVISTIVFNSYLSTINYNISPIGQSLFYGMNILGPAIVVYFTMQYYVKSVIRDGQLLQREKQKSDDLLLNILPAQIAEELKQDSKSEARLYNNVTVILTDFKNFTAYSEKHTPHEIVDELDQCFKAFDEIISRHGIEKIKTIGDGYLAVSGLPNQDPLHAIKMVQAAKEIVAFMEARYAIIGDQTFRIRVGLHSGQVVAGIVGIIKFAYDIWGDTVNIAARMEQNSELGKINISGATYALVKDQFNCTYRGKIVAKNKGEIDMYFVE